ncbi:MAG: putative metal-binding motif-containing protein [Alphaproteobacteria bacterium]|nr:putative metal-binding motif-containing protein [Alphaproteobacteria bacterium]MCB9794023.1 putative metal-binding motif-containing protein [Alphaproteobacteria bacterium]
MRKTPLLLLALLACGEKDAPIDSELNSDDSGQSDDSGADDSGEVDADGDGSPASEDCDDSDALVYPGAEELCDSLDNDCDAAVDEEAADARAWYADSDGDGVGAVEAGGEACALPSGASWDSGDCDDENAEVYPGADEVCDGTDNDCDGLIDVEDEDIQDASTWYADLDGDGFGDPAGAVLACSLPQDYVADDSDCDDGDAEVHPGAQEVCDESGVDEDCDGLVDDDDESVSGTTEWYADSDGDGYGDADSTLEACEAPRGYVDDDTDCDDSDASVYPNSGCDLDWDGSYSGTIDITVTVSSFGISDTCSGTGTVDVDSTQRTPITGTFTCSFSSTLNSVFGSQTITVEGGLDSDVDASGNLYVGSIISGTWSGGFSGNTLTGNTSGSGTYSNYRYTYTGSFDVSR